MSAQVRSARSVRRLLALRRAESENLAALLTVVVPAVQRRSRFVRAVAGVSVAAQFLDSAVDFPDDVVTGAVAVRGRWVPWAFAVACAWESSKCAIRMPGLLPDLVRKAILVYRNRDGHLNPYRMYD